MKVLSKIFFILLCIIALNSFSQNFAPIGAEWYYTNIESFFSSNKGYVKITSVKDTMIQGINYRKLTKTRFSSGGGFYSENDEFLYNSGDTVFRLAENDTNYVLYNFSAGVGDSWTSRTYCLTVIGDLETNITVDSITSTIINNDTLKEFYVSTSSPSGIMSFGVFGQEKFTEKLGGTWYMFPDDYALRDAEIRLGLRCYSDSTFGFYDSGIEPTCTDLYVGMDEINSTNIFKIYPNPTNSILTIEFTEATNFTTSTFRLFNVTGKTVLTQTINFSSIQLDISHYPKGIYFYQITNQEDYFSGKVIIQ